MEPPNYPISIPDQTIVIVSAYNGNNLTMPNTQLQNTLPENSTSSSFVLEQPVEAIESEPVASSRREEELPLPSIPSVAEISSLEESFEHFIQQHAEAVD